MKRSIVTFRAADLEVIKCPEEQQRTPPDPANIVFGHEFTDHMLEVEWTDASGWSRPRISPLHNFSIHPSAKALHYASQLFEGMKAFRGVDGKVRLFRPDMNMKRMNASAARSCFPPFDGEELITCISKLVQIDQKFVFGPETKTSLYIRPAMIGTDPTLGVAKSNQGVLFVILSPVGSYFNPGTETKHANLLADPSHVRAWPGGTGDHKLGSNYGPTIHVQQEAQKKGLNQVLWLFGEDDQVTEVGTMNVFFVFKQKDKLLLVTPPLTDGLILPGVNRDSVLALARNWPDVQVEERRVTMGEVKKTMKDGSLLEMFGAGTACVVSPIGMIQYMGEQLKLPTTGVLSGRALIELDKIVRGEVSPHPWTRIVC